MSITAGWRRRAAARDRFRADQAEVDALVARWERVCEPVGLAQTVATVSGPTVLLPRVEFVELGAVVTLVVRLLAGQVAADVSAVAGRLAAALGFAAARVEPRGHWHVAVRLLRVDPLDVAVPRPAPVRSALDPLVFGQDECGDSVTVELGGAAHLIVQGSSGSGKSVGCYGFLGQLARARDVLVAGSDITGLLLGPWARRADHDGLQALGTRDPARHVAVLERLVSAMDERVAAIPAGHDALPLGAEDPVCLVVVEELPGLLRLLSGDKGLHDRARTAIGRLLAEGRKAAMRVLLVTQRADAKIIGAYERSQASHCTSFRIDTLDGLAMLHPGVPRDVADAHSAARPGIALASAPGMPLRRLRAPHVTYAEYCAAVADGA